MNDPFLTPFLGPDFSFTRVAANDMAALALRLTEGYEPVETTVRFERDGAPINRMPTHIRSARKNDEAEVRRIARESFIYDRFHADPLTRRKADAIKEEWAGNFFVGRRGTHMFVAEEDGIAGFCQVILKDGVLSIDLIATRKGACGHGHATAMVTHACNTLLPSRMVVGTQLANLPSIRLYLKLAFRPTGASITLHRHG